MNLAEMLSYADIQQLKTIATHYQCECSSHSKNELIQSILSTMGRKDAIERHIQQLTLEDIRFMNSMLFESRDTYSLEELLARSSQTIFVKEQKEHYNPREMITKFKQWGWLFNGYSQQNRYLFQIPHDMKKKMCDTLAQKYQAKLVTIDEPSIYRDEQSLLSEDILVFLGYVYQHEIPLTHDGTMYKRFLQQLLDIMSVKEEPPGRGGWRFGYGRKIRDYPDRFSLIYDYCYYNKLIDESNEKLSITELGYEKVQNKIKEQPSALYRFWLRLYMNPIHNLLPLVHWVNRLGDQWVTVDSLKHVLLCFVKPFYYDDEHVIFEQRILRMMMHLGLLKIGEDEHAGQVIKMTTSGKRVIEGITVSEEEQIEIPANTW